MIARVRNRIKFYLERLILRGAHYRLLVMAALVGLVVEVDPEETTVGFEPQKL